MPISFKICLERNFLYAKWQGQITVPEYLEVFHAYLGCAHYRPGRPELIDTSDMLDFDLDFHEMRRLLRNVNSQSYRPNVNTKTVVYCPNDFIFGLGHMYQQLAELDDGIKVELYEKEADALNALELPYKTIEELHGKENFI